MSNHILVCPGKIIYPKSTVDSRLKALTYECSDCGQTLDPDDEYIKFRLFAYDAWLKINEMTSNRDKPSIIRFRDLYNKFVGNRISHDQSS